MLHDEKTFPGTWNHFAYGTFYGEHDLTTRSAQWLHGNLLGDTGARGHST